jgi:hypothetical protein
MNSKNEIQRYKTKLHNTCVSNEFYTSTTPIMMRLLLLSSGKWQLEVQHFVVITMQESEYSYC